MAKKSKSESNPSNLNWDATESEKSQARAKELTKKVEDSKSGLGKEDEQAAPTNGVDVKVQKPMSKFLTFFLAEEEYGIEIIKVQEIIGLLPITRVPQTPQYVRGVINLRGRVIPVIDLRSKFNLPPVPATPETCIIVVEANKTILGAIVDRVSEVAIIADDEIEETPDFGATVSTENLLGISKDSQRVRLLLDIDKVLSLKNLARAGQSESRYDKFSAQPVKDAVA